MNETKNNIYLEEYKTLREEHLYYTKSRDQISFLLITGIYFLTVYFFSENSEKLNYWFYYIPIIVVLYVSIYYKIRTFNLMIIDYYISEVIESNKEVKDQLHWHRFAHRLEEKKKEYKWHRREIIGRVFQSLFFSIPLIASSIKIISSACNTWHFCIDLFILLLSIGFFIYIWIGDKFNFNERAIEEYKDMIKEIKKLNKNKKTP